MPLFASFLFIFVTVFSLLSLSAGANDYNRNNNYNLNENVNGQQLNNFKNNEIKQKVKNIVQQCCADGRQYAEYRNKCDAAWLPNNSDECSLFWMSCCYEQLMLSQCKPGKDYINQQYQCSQILSNSKDSIVSFECCSACQLGFNWSNSLEPANSTISQCSAELYRSIQLELYNLTIGLQSKLEETFVDCCNQAKLETVENFSRNLNDKQEVIEKLPLFAKLTETKTDIRNFCGNGYEYNSSSPTKCADIDECETGSYECEAPNINCVNTIGSYFCSKCKTGFRLRSPEEQRHYHYGPDKDDDCVDVNECNDNPCLAGQSCMNVVGSYKCFCQVGYQMDSDSGQCKDVNECQLGTHNCHETLRCDNTIGSFHCVRVQDCGTGYTINADRDVCEDIDECILGIHDCGVEFQCRNTLGTFKCDRISCPFNQQLIHGMCKSIECDNGKLFDYSIGRCIDNDPCHNNKCSSSEQCLPLQSSSGSIAQYQCVANCPPGYHFKNSSCVDINECITGVAECAPNQNCVNLEGHYDCECKPGFSMDSNRRCNDIDECRLEGLDIDCPYPFRCTNIIGSYQCDQCHTGYRMSTDGHCVDIDECLIKIGLSSDNSPVCDHICHNVPGSFKCDCREGFRLSNDNRSCIDIDECKELFNNYQSSKKSGRSCLGVCLNTIGSFECNCPDGFRKVNDHCVDINECLEKNTICPNRDESCINILGSFKCLQIVCPTGYKKFTGYKSIQCVMTDNGIGLLSADNFNQYSYLYYSLYNNQTDLTNQLTSTGGYRFYATRFGDSSTSSTTSYGTYFDLKFVSATKPQTGYSDFSLKKRSSNEATISIMKPLPGPQTIKLELVIVGYKKGAYYRQKVFFTIDISNYNSM